MTSDDSNESSIEFIRSPEVKRLTGLGSATIYRMATTGAFPGQVKIGEQAVAWINQRCSLGASIRSKRLVSLAMEVRDEERTMRYLNVRKLSSTPGYDEPSSSHSTRVKR